MDDTIMLDGVSSAAKSVHVLAWDIPLSAKRDRQAEILPGRLTALRAEYATQEPRDVMLTLAVVGDGQAALFAAYRAAARWLWQGTRLSLSALPGSWYEGEMTEITILELTDAYMTFRALFTANPPYLQHARSALDGFIPSGASPIPEQITEGTKTCAKTFTATGTLPAVTLTGMEAPALYLTISGTWSALTIGTLTIGRAAASAMTVYIDCEAQEVYSISAGTRESLMGSVSGDFPALSSGVGLTVGGTGINITVRALVIERG